MIIILINFIVPISISITASSDISWWDDFDFCFSFSMQNAYLLTEELSNNAINVFTYSIRPGGGLIHCLPWRGNESINEHRHIASSWCWLFHMWLWLWRPYLITRRRNEIIIAYRGAIFQHISLSMSLRYCFMPHEASEGDCRLFGMRIIFAAKRLRCEAERNIFIALFYLEMKIINIAEAMTASRLCVYFSNGLGRNDFKAVIYYVWKSLGMVGRLRLYEITSRTFNKAYFRLPYAKSRRSRL